MRETISAFLKDLGVPDGTVGLEMLGEALEKSMSLIQQRRRINLTVLCAALGDKYGQSSESIDRAMRRALDFAVYRTGQAPNVLMSEVKRNWSRDAKTVFFNIFSVNGMCTDEISKGIFFENETSKKIFLQSLATNSLRITDFTDCFESSAVADIKLAGAKEEIMTALEPYYIIFKQFQYMYAKENIRNGVLECNA